MPTDVTRLSDLRQELNTRGLDGFFIPLTDEHMSEYIGAYAQRLTWLTGFDGSAGFVAVLASEACIFVDGRYTLQVRDQVDPDLFQYGTLTESALQSWVTDRLTEGSKIGFDPSLATTAWASRMEKALGRAGISLTPETENPVDAVWPDRPREPLSPVRVHREDYAGESAASKRARVAEILRAQRADCAVITLLDSLAWAFNIRGSDVERTPVVHAYALLHADETADLFIEDAKLSDEVRHHLGHSVRIAPRAAFFKTLETLGAAGTGVLLDPNTANARIFKSLTDSRATILEADEPTILMKAVKNEIEQKGTRAAHIRDGAAVTNFLAWFEEAALQGNQDELSVAARLWAERQKTGLVLDSSFDTISGSGPNGAIMHYRVTEATNRAIKKGDVYLVDSGAQYLDGTTDITRTTQVGIADPEVMDRYTRVLKGHIAIATARFPKGTSGQALDSFARRPLWEVGLDFAHGTGHGVGSYLAVHEGPQRIAKVSSPVPLQPGMILSNEPGYYKPGAYGIRIENLVLVTELETDGEETLYGFETLTLAPYERKLINVALLTDDERAWVDAYHARVRAELSPIVDDTARPWLEAMTQPLIDQAVAAE